MDNSFFISELLFKLKNNLISIDEVCEFFPEGNRNLVEKFLKNMEYPLNADDFAKIISFFNK